MTRVIGLDSLVTRGLSLITPSFSMGVRYYTIVPYYSDCMQGGEAILLFGKKIMDGRGLLFFVYFYPITLSLVFTLTHNIYNHPVTIRFRPSRLA